MGKRKLGEIIVIASAALLALGVYGLDALGITLPDGSSIYHEMIPLAGPSSIVSEKDEEIPRPTASRPSTAAHLAQEGGIVSGDCGTIDLSHASEGYASVFLTADTGKNFMCAVEGPGALYSYPVEPNQTVTLPLSEGNGEYIISLVEHIEDNRYWIKLAAKATVTLDDERTPFLVSSPVVDWADAADTIRKAGELAGGLESDQEKIDAIYAWVVENLKYDEALAETVSSGYLPDLDAVLAKRKGICFDYAALTAGMLRSQGIPCRLVMGYVGGVYHAWISVYTKDAGWSCMDPTMESGVGSLHFIRRHIGDGVDYTPARIY